MLLARRQKWLNLDKEGKVPEHSIGGRDINSQGLEMVFNMSVGYLAHKILV
jgi:hypothetical protein